MVTVAGGLRPELSDEERARNFASCLPAPKLRELQTVFVRELREADLAKPAQAEGLKPLKAIRQAHHQLARLLARGTEPAAASLITGFDLATVYSIQHNETFKELMAHYLAVEAIAEADLKGQMSSVGQAALQELGKRLDEAPEDFSINHLHDTIDLLLVQPMKGVPANAGGQLPTLQVSFITASTPQLREVIDGEIIEGAEGARGDH